MLGTFFGAPVPVLSANSPLTNSRQIKASQMVLGIANHSAVSIPPKEEPGFRPKKGLRRLLTDALGAAHQRANIRNVFQKSAGGESGSGAA